MRVRFKQTGQTGTIPDDKFDPALFDKIDGVNIDVAVRNVQPQQDGFVKSAVKGLIKPAVDFGKLVAGTGFEVARATDSALGNKDAYDIQKGAKNPFITREEFQKDYSTPEDILLQTTKKTAGAGSYFVPGGAGVGGAIKAGAAAGGLYGLSQSEEKDIEGLAADTLIGAGTGAAVGGAVGVGGKVLSKMRGGGDSLRKGVIKPDVNPDPFMAEEESMIAKTVQKYGAKGSAEAQKQQIPGIFRSITKDIQSKLANSKGSVGTADATRLIDEALDNNINFDVTNPIMLKARDKYINQLLSLVNKSDDALNIRPDGLFQYKQNLGKQLSNVFKKIDKGTPLNEKEEVAVTVWHTIDDLLTKAEPGVKELTKAQSYLYKAMPGIARQSEATLTAPIIGKIPGAGVVQGTQDIIGRGMQTVGNVVDKVPQAVPSVINRAATMGAVNKTVDSQGMDVNNAVQQEQVLPTPNELPQIQQQQQESPNGLDMSDEDMVVAMMQYDLQTTGGKNIPEIKSMYEISAAKNKKEKGTVGMLTAKDAGTIHAGLKNLQDVRVMLNEDFSLLKKQLVPGQPFSRQLDSALYDMADTLLRLRTGAQANPSEIKGYMNKIAPNWLDSPEDVKYKLDKLESDLKAYSDSAGTGSDINSLQYTTP